MSDRLRVRYNRTAAELDRFLEVVEGGEGCVPVALAAASGRTLGEVLDVIGKLPMSRGRWWMTHAANLGLDVEDVFPDNFPWDSVDDLHGLPPGLYLIDGTGHLAAVEITDSAVKVAEPQTVVRYEPNGQIPAEAIDHILQTEAQRAVLESKGIEPGEPLVKIYSVNAKEPAP